jgi:hypothetical protein
MPSGGHHQSMGAHQSAVMLSCEWLTPPDILKALGGAPSFNLDPAAPFERPWPMAREHYTAADNGLEKPWHGRVWLNPPYGGPNNIGPWMRRMAAHDRGTMLTFARTETALFFEAVWQAATAVLFIEGRLHFHYGQRAFVPRLGRWAEIGERAGANAGAPSCLVAYGEKDARILHGCGIAGQFVMLKAMSKLVTR